MKPIPLEDIKDGMNILSFYTLGRNKWIQIGVVKGDWMNPIHYKMLKTHKYGIVHKYNMKTDFSLVRKGENFLLTDAEVHSIIVDII